LIKLGIWGPSESKTTNEEPIILIGITGRKRSGKDTIGNYLVNNHGFVRVAFADALKDACQIIFGLTSEQVYGDLKEIKDKYWDYEPRELLQIVGTDLFREALPNKLKKIGPDIWIRSVDRKIKQLMESGYKRFVITDIRFPNELEFIKNNNGISWKVTRKSVIPQDLSSVHASEREIDNLNCDIVFENEQTIVELLRHVDNEFISSYSKLCNKSKTE